VNNAGVFDGPATTRPRDMRQMGDEQRQALARVFAQAGETTADNGWHAALKRFGGKTAADAEPAPIARVADDAEMPKMYDPKTDRGVPEDLYDVKPNLGQALSKDEFIEAALSGKANFATKLQSRKALEVEAQQMAQTMGVKLGLGKFSKTFDTGLHLSKGGSLTRGVATLAGLTDAFTLRPLAKVFRRMEDVVRHASDDAVREWTEYAAKHGMTEQDAVLMYTVGAWRSAALRASDDATRAGLMQEVDETVEMLRTEGLWDTRHDELLDASYRHLTDLRMTEGGGIDAFYMPQSATDESMRAQYQASKDAVGGRRVRRKSIDLSKIKNYSRQEPTPFSRTSQEGFAQELTKQGGLSDDIARGISERIEHSLSNMRVDGKRVGFREPEELADELLVPDLNLFAQMAKRDVAHYNRVLEKQTEQLVIEQGIAKWDPQTKELKFADERDRKLFESLVTSANLAHVPGTLSSVGAGNFVLHQLTPMLKAIFTTYNPGHYPRNAWGDWSNSMSNGGWQHVFSNPLRPLGWKLAKGDKEAMEQTWKIGGKDYTGAEVYMLARWMGLGRGFVKSDIIETRGFFSHALPRKMQELNVDRENAQRISTFVKHMRGGDDPLTASVKTLRVHFDYNELTAFEKQTIRNLLLFYTWLKRNTILQTSTLATRPGYQSAAVDVMNAREPFENELPYYSEVGAAPNPFGAGGIVWGNPVSDGFNKLNFTGESFRKNVLSSLNPLAKVPIEGGMGREIYTGKEIDSFPDYLRHTFEGPFLGNIERSVQLEEGSPWQVYLGGITGLAPQQDQQQKFKRFAKYTD
jgi:hypothetical protein